MINGIKDWFYNKLEKIVINRYVKENSLFSGGGLDVSETHALLRVANAVTRDIVLNQPATDELIKNMYRALYKQTALCDVYDNAYLRSLTSFARTLKCDAKYLNEKSTMDLYLAEELLKLADKMVEKRKVTMGR